MNGYAKDPVAAAAALEDFVSTLAPDPFLEAKLAAAVLRLPWVTKEEIDAIMGTADGVG